jgi:serine/threonine protein kinase
MSSDLDIDDERERRRNRVLLEYVESLANGRAPDRDRLLAEHPDLRQDLEEFLAGYDEIARLTAPIRHEPAGRATARRAKADDVSTSVAGRAGSMRDETEGIPPGIGELGDFRLLREVGRGGMGVVYEAEQISLRRRVALKVLPFAAAIDTRRLHRFKTEALAAAHVQHEKIVPVHAVGCERGVHYYAMRFIDGQSLAELISDLRRLRRDRRFESSKSRRGSTFFKIAPAPDHEPIKRETEREIVKKEPNNIKESSSNIAKGAERSAAKGNANLFSDHYINHLGSTDDSATSKLVLAISRELSSDRRRYFDRVAELCRQAALALEHAHQAGIVHRDVKPGNLLLDLNGDLWVTDFGLAQVAGNVGLTITGELLGTLRYMSPEQLSAKRGVFDHRADVYSLGATLYELLTLRPPFEGNDRNTLIRRIADDDPTPPRRLDDSIPHNLETIVLKALRKAPADRYETAREMADDLRRYLDGKSILARPPTLIERMKIWLYQHPTITGAGVVALILLLVASLISTALIRREQRKTLEQKVKAEIAYDDERRRAEEAEARFRLARSAVDELIRVSEEELAHFPGMEGLRKRLLDSALDYYRLFVEQRRNDPASRADLLDSTRRVETILADLEVLRAAGDLYLVIQPAALDDLQLDQDQRTKVADLSARAGSWWIENFGEHGGSISPARRVRMAIVQARSNEAELDAILRPAQRKRLRQIVLQSEGPRAFRDPEVVRSLGLTPEQRERIHAIEETNFFNRMIEIRSGRPAEEPSESLVDRIQAELTLDQKRIWNNMIGPPIHGKLSVFPMPFQSRRNP